MRALYTLVIKAPKQPKKPLMYRVGDSILTMDTYQDAYFVQEILKARGYTVDIYYQERPYSAVEVMKLFGLKLVTEEINK